MSRPRTLSDPPCPSRRRVLQALAASAVAWPGTGYAAAPGASSTAPRLTFPDGFSLRALTAAPAAPTGQLISPWSLAAIVDLARSGLAAPPPAPGGLPPTLLQTAAVWLDSGQHLTDAAAAHLAQAWTAHVETLNLARAGQARINDWTAEATDGRIPAVIGEPLREADLVLTHAILFRDAWRRPFDPDRTASMPFHAPDGNAVDVPFMTGEAAMPSWRVPGGRVVALGFDGGGQILLYRPEGSEAWDQAVPAALAGRSLDFDRAEAVRVALPRLDLAADLDLTDLVAALDLDGRLQEGLARLTRTSLVLGPVAQAVRLKADEAGAEAAAATTVIATRSAQVTEAPLLRFDRPFSMFLTLPGQATAIVAATVATPS